MRRKGSPRASKIVPRTTLLAFIPKKIHKTSVQGVEKKWLLGNKRQINKKRERTETHTHSKNGRVCMRMTWRDDADEMHPPLPLAGWLTPSLAPHIRHTMNRRLHVFSHTGTTPVSQTTAHRARKLPASLTHLLPLTKLGYPLCELPTPVSISYGTTWST